MARLMSQESQMREDLEAANRRLLELQHQLARQSRLDERLRITQDLHDVFGHRLTALSLNLEAAAHGKDTGILSTAQSLVRALLDDVKALVSAQKDELPVDLAAELRGLARDLPAPQIELQCPEQLTLLDPRASRALLRCAQEFVTNAIRHGAATRVWIRIESSGTEVSLQARDNGSGGECFRDGFGLSGMRRRMHELGGALQAGVGAAGNFEVTATVPSGSGAA
jgi:signal transduction histidine kinase